MSNLDEIAEVVKDAGLNLAGEIAANPTIEGGYFIPVAMGATVKGRRNPSGRVLADTRRRLHEMGFDAEFILMSDLGKKLEESLRHSLMSSFPSLVRNAFLSGENDAPQVWLEAKRSLDEKTTKQLEVHLEEFAKRLALKTIKLNNLRDAQTPTKTELLFAIRTLAPIGSTALCDELSKQKFVLPSVDWLDRQLESLRQSGFLVRTQTGNYALTLDALRRLGTSRSKRSRDVERLLALARRRD